MYSLAFAQEDQLYSTPLQKLPPSTKLFSSVVPNWTSPHLGSVHLLLKFLCRGLDEKLSTIFASTVKPVALTMQAQLSRSSPTVARGESFPPHLSLIFDCSCNFSLDPICCLSSIQHCEGYLRSQFYSVLDNEASSHNVEHFPCASALLTRSVIFRKIL